MYGVKEFLSNLSGICRDSSTAPERRGQADENSFYAFMQNRKSAIVHSFSSKLPLDPMDMSTTTGSIRAASTDSNSYVPHSSHSAGFSAKIHHTPLSASTLSQGVDAGSGTGYKKGSKLSSFLGEHD